MTTMQTTTKVLLHKLVNADTQGIQWEALSPAEQYLAKELEGGLVDFEPRWQPNPGQTAMVAKGQCVLASQSGRLEVLRRHGHSLSVIGHRRPVPRSQRSPWAGQTTRPWSSRGRLPNGTPRWGQR